MAENQKVVSNNIEGTIFNEEFLEMVNPIIGVEGEYNSLRLGSQVYLGFYDGREFIVAESYREGGDDD